MTGISTVARRPWLLTAAQVMSMLAISALAGFTIGMTGLAAAGMVPWIELPVIYDGQPLPRAGAALQVAASLVMLTLLFYLPSARRVLALEAGHRSFRLGVEDVARAYRACHAADREGVFTLEEEFDAVRERYAFLRAHPDLGELEGEVLELAAEMSFESRDLADTFAEEKVARARDFLRQRKAQIATTERRLRDARATCGELRRWLKDIENGERNVSLELRELERDLLDLLPKLGFETEIEDRPRPKPRAASKGGTVVPIQRGGSSS
jgi:hypothetical protein